LLGTAVQDNGMLEHAFAEACATQGIVPGTTDYAHYMVAAHRRIGEPAVDVFRGLFHGNLGRAEAAALSFERSFRAAIDRHGVLPVPGAQEVIEGLRDAGIRVCMITGLSRRLLGILLDTLGWWRLVDLALSPEDVPRGYPWPDLVLAAMLRLGVEDVREAAYAGGTTSGIRCGKRAGAGIVAGVLTGGHTRDRLREAGATHFITAITDFPALLADAGTDLPVRSAKMPEADGRPEVGSRPEAGGRPEAGDRPGAGAAAREAAGGVAERAVPGPGSLVPPQASASQIARQVP